MAVIGATQLEPANLMGSYVQGLEAGRQARAQRMQEEALLGQTQRETALRNFLSSADLSKPEVRNQLLRFGKPGAELAASIEDIESKRATAQKTGLEISAAKMKMADDNYGRFQKMLGDFAYGKTAPTKQRVVDELDFLIAQGVVAPQFKEFAQSTLPDDPAQLQVALRNQFLSQIPPAERAKLFVPKSAEVLAQDIERASAGASRISIAPSAKKFSEKFGEKAAEQFDTLYTQAQGAEQSINLSRQLKPLLNNPDFISGTLGNVRLELAKALGLPGAEETQAYFAGIGGQVAQIIKSFGAGTGLSDADRKFAERMAGGSEELTTDAIKRIVRLNDEASKFVLKKYNTRRSELSRKDREIADYYPEVRVAVREGTIKSGPDKGRRVVEYSDGTSEYAD